MLLQEGEDVGLPTESVSASVCSCLVRGGSEVTGASWVVIEGCGSGSGGCCCAGYGDSWDEVRCAGSVVVRKC